MRKEFLFYRILPKMLGEVDAVTFPFKKIRIIILFKFPDVSGDGRLTNMQRFCRLREAQTLCHRKKHGISVIHLSSCSTQL